MIIQSLGNGIAVAYQDAVLGVHAGIVGLDMRDCHARALRRQHRRIASADFLALFNFPFKAFHFCEQHSRLKRIETAVDTDTRVMIATILPMHANFAHGFGQGVVVR